MLLLVSLQILGSGAIALGVASENKGTQDILLEGGKRGHVPFPHYRHQENLQDCQICHSVFEQKSGSIEKLKAQGNLKKKYVMNKLCTQCHKQTKKAGKKSGPTTCAKCHIKQK
jgi:hypothetical protein